jgi:hypothetical protein
VGGKASQYIIRGVPGRRSRIGISALIACLLGILAAAGCRALLPAEYEYDEQVDLALDGSATVYVNGSVPALVALRGIPLDTRPNARLDREAVRAFFTSPGVRVSRIGTSRKHDRRFVHLRLEVDDVRTLDRSRALGWEHVTFGRVGGQYVYVETVGEPAGRPVPDVGWTGGEQVAFRLHLPARIRFHNAPSREVERGNILTWQQPLADRRQGTPIRMEARMDPESILYSTLLLFGAMAALVTLTFAVILWWLMRKGRATQG